MSYKTGDIINFEYTGGMQTVTLPKGIYKLECWGAQGGTYNSYIGGYGGYSVGTLTLNEKTKLYVYTGGSGSSSSTTAGFNGGGKGVYNGRGGGGASDIRIWQDSLYARVIAAGGGGGAGVASANVNPAGCGGGTYGGDGFYNNTTGSYTTGSNRSGGSASQTAGGISWNSISSTKGTFGQGGNASTYSCGGGGGGWYGGGGAYDNDSDSDGRWGGGGSGYVYTADTASNYPSGCLLNSTYYLTDASTIAGNTAFTSPSGTSETGHTGNGYCRITVIEIATSLLLCKVNSEIKSAKSICFKINNKIYGFGTSTAAAIMDFDYTGAVQTTTLSPGKYMLECWGAQGGTYSTTYYGGKGGYSKGILTLTQNTNIFIYSGGQGSLTTVANKLQGGGFNGGGNTTTSDASYSGCGGGGASDIRIGTDSLYARVIVAGGGGGAFGPTVGYGIGGCGGGESGGDGASSSSSYVGGKGATQTAIGTSYYGTSTVNATFCTPAAFGVGSSRTTGYIYGSAGGGGWYGGGSALRAGGGGGSGYIYTSSTASNYPDGCLLNSTYYLTNASISSGDAPFTSPTGSSEVGHTGNGFVRITKLTDTIYLNQNNETMDFDYTGAVQTVTVNPGTYKLECWGAQGGYRSSSDKSGKGGYSVGTLTLTEETTLYIYSGGAGNTVTTASAGIYPGGFNGGGYRYNYKGGGGASDIRIGTDSLYARVIVAGGGGSDGGTSYAGGYGGGTTGGNGSGGCYSTYKGSGGTQTGNSDGHTCNSSQGTSNSSSNCPGGFGFGGFGVYRSSGYGGAGGGGWYGGEGTYPDSSADDDYGGGGGSGYVYNADNAANYPSGCLLNSSHYLSDAQTIAGNVSFTSPSGTSETGHTGNGYCRITKIDTTRYGLFIKQNGVWNYIDI